MIGRMAKKTYKGSCHCGKVTFEADLDFAEGTGRCNCSICFKSRNWGIGGKPADFRLLTGKDDLSDYTKSPAAHNMFCKHCGIRVYGWGNIPQIGGDYVSVSVAALDGVEPAEMLQAPIKFQDGRHDKWWEVPAETRHL
jgi:hypothetical protein